MTGDWYYARDKRRFGLFTFDQFRQLAASGVLSPADMVWQEGTQRWLTAAGVAGLFPAALLTTPVAIPSSYWLVWSGSRSSRLVSLRGVWQLSSPATSFPRYLGLARSISGRPMASSR